MKGHQCGALIFTWLLHCGTNHQWFEIKIMTMMFVQGLTIFVFHKKFHIRFMDKIVQQSSWFHFMNWLIEIFLINFCYSFFNKFLSYWTKANIPGPLSVNFIEIQSFCLEHHILYIYNLWPLNDYHQLIDHWIKHISHESWTNLKNDIKQ